MAQNFVLGHTFSHGVHPPEHKKGTRTEPIERLGFAPTLVVPLAQHIGAPAKAVVAKKQEVARGELIAEAGGFVSVPMHAPAAGTVTKIDLALIASGSMAPAVYIKVDPEASQEALEGEPFDIEAAAPGDLVGAVQQAGLVGLGGAAFPTHVKMTVPEGKTIDTVLANGCECEPYLTCDHRLMLEQKDELFAGLAIALKATGADRAIIGIEDNKQDALALLRDSVPHGLPIFVAPVKTKYPQGAEKMLIKALLNREVPSGGLPMDVNVACFNVSTLAQMAALLPKRQGLIERVVTVTGPGVRKPGNYLIPLGTPLQFILDHVGLTDDARQVILGGPMMGPSVSSLDVPTTKGVSGILALTQKELDDRPKQVYPCIKCGSCVEACPLYLNPSLLGALARKEEYEAMEQGYHLNDCFECASCTYVCPSNIPLVQYFRIAKSMNRERKAAKRK
ncbi:MAG: electron transport complex subunit RsxC [Nitrospiraceae bacterium]|nr:electron transport complex subunit RsxC [Nitrospiraceae bacterium]